MATDWQSLVARIERHDKALGAEVANYAQGFLKRREFGLNFEKHLPETVALPGRLVAVGDKVRFIAPRGIALAKKRGRKRPAEALREETWLVTGLADVNGVRTADLVIPESQEEANRAVEDLVVVADFRDPIYPGLTSTGLVERGADKPFHSVINGENFHALEALLFTHQGKVDAIYIDPPYNTGATDWKYNNDYVDGEDAYRHSKWLSFMERRLKLAKKLLNPDGSVLVVTIDEKEYLRLGLLLEQTFQGSTIQMVSSLINPKGTGRANEFNRVDEYLFFVWQGDATLGKLPADVEGGAPSELEQSLPWDTMRRRNLASVRGRTGPGACGPNQLYAIHVDRESGAIVGRGNPIPVEMPINTYSAPEGTVAVFPVRKDGTEMNWSLTDSAFDKRWGRGYVRAGKATPGDPQPYLIQYLTSSTIAALEGPTGVISDPAPDGSASGTIRVSTARIPRTQWTMQSHNAEHYGTAMVKSMLGGRQFPFPKSVYAVEDTLRLFVGDRPEAVVVDFFAGSGTTAHAVMRLNRQDGGRRVSISVTNNEVSSDEQAGLILKGLRQGDPAWEAQGICDYITKPRIEAAITGTTPDGKPIKGEYKFTDVFQMAEGFEENAEFFTLTYEAPALVELDLAYERIAPLLWLKAGSRGRRINDRKSTFEVAEAYGVLFSVDFARPFLEAMTSASEATHAFIVTDDEPQFQTIAEGLPAGVHAVRLYESYLRTFEINTGRE